MKKLAIALIVCYCGATDMPPVFPKQFKDYAEEFVWKYTEGRVYSYRTCMSVEDIPSCAARFPLEFANISKQNAARGIIAHNHFMCANGDKRACDNMIKASQELNRLIQEYPSVEGK